MAQEKDVTRRAKFFVRKKTCDGSQLCEKCQHHQYVIMVRLGCDAMVFTNTKLRLRDDFRRAANQGQYLHLWCINADDPPNCLEQFKQVSALR